MALTLSEALSQVESLKYSKAIWLEVIEHLRIFVDDEVRKAKKGIASDGRVVPQSIIKEFVDRVLFEELEPLSQKIVSLEKLSVEEKKDDQIKHDKKVSEAGRGEEAKETGKKEGSSRSDTEKRPILSAKRKAILRGSN